MGWVTPYVALALTAKKFVTQLACSADQIENNKTVLKKGSSMEAEQSQSQTY